ncbi:MAG TPA: NAD(P)H-dependent oxidoreductase [Puia sp.]|jgi:FMN-dependent NADH-azoreductase|nr:NAD(P)H-dependent oxidoreductase [Puia sp.]
MKKILHIVSSVKGNESFSNKLSNAIIQKLSSAYPGSSVHIHDLTKSPFPHLDQTHFSSFYTPEQLRTPEHKEAIKRSDEAIKVLMEADIIVIGVPLYNFGIPSTLKAWIDHIVRAGVTFRYANGVPEGLVTSKKVYLAIASGGVYSEGPMKSHDFTESYLRTALGFIGMTDIKVFRVEGALLPELKEKALPNAIDTVNNFALELMSDHV